jgi:hypothetical protein
MALFYRHYKTRSPSQAELLDEGLKKLRGYFQGVEYNNPFQTGKDPPGKLAGKPAWVVEFEGIDPDSVEVRGQVYLMSAYGYAYWFFTWAPGSERERAEPAWEQVRSRFRLHRQIVGWKEKPRETVPFQGRTVPYRLDYARDVWRAQDKPQDEAASAELALRGFEPIFDESGKRTRVEYSARAATVVVLVLPKAGSLDEAQKTARAHLLKQEQVLYPETRIAPVADRTGKAAFDRVTELGDFRGHLARLRVSNSPERERYAVLGVINRGEGVVVAFCECDWKRRDFWDQEFKALLDTLRPASGRPGKAAKAKKGR